MIPHPWHSIFPGNNAPTTVNSIIEITKGSRAKYELDKVTGLLRLDRVLRTQLTYPAHYGFIPQTYCQDTDPLDIIVICSEPLIPLSIVEATVIGAFNMIDNGQQDDKILAIATHDPRLSAITDLPELPKELLHQIQSFFEQYKKEENKEVIIKKLFNQHEAQQLVGQAMQAYNIEFKK